MADVRALLRQQRAARRIEHPHAAYTDAGKLVCVLCREHIKTEALWDGHIRSTGHRQRLQALQQQQQNGTAEETADQPQKRKFDTQEDDEATSPVSTDETDRASKRTRPNTLSPEPGPAPPTSHPEDATKPPTLTRQQSFTPTAGIELAIPSRPATPADVTTTPKSAGGPLRPFSQLSEQQQQHSQPPTSQPTPTSAPPTTSEPTPAPADAPQVDDDLWASFEADLLAPPKPPAAAALAEGDAVISAAPVSAAEAAAAKSHDEEQSLRRAAKDIEIEDEREEATRALEAEFEVMEELEARARRLRERREALRAGKLGSVSAQGSATEAGPGEEVTGTMATPVEGVGKTSAAAAVLAALGKENAAGTAKGKTVEEEEDEDDDEDDEDDDWDGFRFRA
ncbi:hypothetical protein B0T20DRAFT_117437 [Sordaria brevicollis]|uniref:Zinc finger double-stranded RNA binding domain-containing protein n=1 Tax=Sordaria brevicollis TaxID=83679 RepID=A0AAE0PK95_SORBR|nr:hypothetical protein B0T20DRAFT_117437 [Sordaria brevicollis]